ncbi:MAG TPA: hypothetical protein VFZ59_25945 [Verrucomicrobiae bacterium]|nr:hypothetical protein [Verrucomicrobiae bacterium]
MLPIVDRELRVRARQPATFWVRFGTALIGLCICALQVQSWGSDSSELGAAVFSSLVTTAFLGCTVAFLLTTDLIASERRENTLGLLFLTRVKSFDVLVGKTVSGGLSALLALAGFLPVLMLPVLLGGVAPGDAFRKGVVLLVFLMAAMIAGIWASSGTSDWLKSIGLAALVVLLVFVPVAALAMVAATEYRATGIPIYWFLLGLLMLVAAWQFAFAKRNLHRAVTESGEVRVATPIWKAVVRRRAPLADHVNPIEWCVRHERGVRVAFWVASGLSMFVKSIGLLFESMRTGSSFYLPSPVMWVLWLMSLGCGFASTALQAWAASRFIQAARRTGELEVILTTPLGAGDFITGHWRALRGRIRLPVTVSLLPVILHAAIYLGLGVLDRREGIDWPVFLHDLWTIAITWVEVVAICWVGMWFGLRATRPASAVAMTVGLVDGLPFAVTMLSWLGLTFIQRFQPADAWGFRLMTYLFASGFLIALVFWARWRLQTGLAGVKHVRFGARSDWEELREAWQRRRGTAASTS